MQYRVCSVPAGAPVVSAGWIFAAAEVATTALNATISVLNAMSFLLEWRRWLTPFAERGLAPFVRPDQLALSPRVLLRCFFDILDPGAGGQAKLVHVECKKCEMIVMQSVSWWRARAAVPGVSEVVERLSPHLLACSDRACV